MIPELVFTIRWNRKHRSGENTFFSSRQFLYGVVEFVAVFYGVKRFVCC